MDIRLNNEALIACVVAQVVSKGLCSVARLTALIPILLNEGFRNKIVKNAQLTERDCYKVGMEYKELLVPVMNSVIMLIEAKCLFLNKDGLSPIENTKNLCLRMDKSSKRLSRILADLDPVMKYFDCDTIENNYKKLFICL